MKNHIRLNMLVRNRMGLKRPNIKPHGVKTPMLMKIDRRECDLQQCDGHPIKNSESLTCPDLSGATTDIAVSYFNFRQKGFESMLFQFQAKGFKLNLQTKKPRQIQLRVF